MRKVSQIIFLAALLVACPVQAQNTSQDELPDDYVPFTLHQLQLKPGDTFYTFSDGFADQFGGPKRKKFLAKNFRNLLLSVQDLSMLEQGNRLDEVFSEYRNNFEQVDDVVVIGVKA